MALKYKELFSKIRVMLSSQEQRGNMATNIMFREFFELMEIFDIYTLLLPIYLGLFEMSTKLILKPI